MDHPLKQSRNSSVDVSQLDKINAIPNKTTHNVLMEGLCNEDQLYLNVLMDNDSSNSDDDEFDAKRQSSTWSPMIQNPVIMNKRLKKLRPSYAVTLSLEDISYIRPSWGISKGIRTIELNKKKKQLADSKELAKKNKKEKDEKSKSKSSNNSNDAALHYLLVLLTFVILLLTVPPYMMKRKRVQDKIVNNRMYLDGSKRFFEIYPPSGGDKLEPILRVQFNQGLAANIKAEECDCDLFENELKQFMDSSSEQIGTNKNNDNLEHWNKNHTCFTCLDWAMRNNLRVLVEKKEKKPHSTSSYIIPGEEDTYCYHIKWQSYDSLATPLIDCFLIGDEQWFGLGDIQTSSWPLNILQFNWTPLNTNLTVDLPNQSLSKFSDYIATHKVIDQLNFGSYVNLSLMSTNGIFVSNLRTDFKVSVQLTQDGQSEASRVCLVASCTYKCEQNWPRFDHLREFKYVNNVLEYSICSANNLKVLISDLVEEKTQLLLDNIKKKSSSGGNETSNQTTTTKQTNQILQEKKYDKLIEKESVTSNDAIISLTNESGHEPLLAVDGIANTIDKNSGSTSQEQSTTDAKKFIDLPEGIGLIERTIFATSLESLPVLDGQTLRLYVDNIVKLGLKTSSILLIDSRWETYVGSLKLNIALFPKSKLLFEILHNKGFRIVFTIKPYIDTAIGIGKINQLFESGRLYAYNYKKIRQNAFLDKFVDSFSQQLFKNQPSDSKTSTTIEESIIRRSSLFSFKNQTIELASNDSNKFPYMFKCKDSQEGYCALLDLTQASNRLWFINNIKKSITLTAEADGIQIGGVHPMSSHWDDHFRAGVSELVRTLFFKEKIYTLSQWTGDLGYIQLAPRQCDWNGLKSVVNSVLNLGMMGFSLVHPGSVWGDLKLDSNSTQTDVGLKTVSRMDSIYRDIHQSSSSENAELIIRWLQVSIFLPILQFNDISPIEKYGLQDLVQNLVRIRKMHIVPELKKNLPFTPTINQTKSQNIDVTNLAHFPLIRPVWFTQEGKESIVMEQFTIGADILIAPILSKGLKQRDIYLPSGFWHDELRSINLRGGKWLKNYPVELNEIAWFTRAKR